MTNYENHSQALEDRRVVDETIAELETQLQLQTESAWRGTWEQSAAFIEGLYRQYAPNVSEEGRLIGQMLGAIGLTNVALRYGADEHHPKLYSGQHEQRVLATYHTASHSLQFVENCFRYAYAVNQLQPGVYDEAAFIRFPVIGGYHDLVMGNGRGNDERQSAMVGAEMFMRLGLTLTPDEATSEGITTTGWDDQLQCQAIDRRRPYLEYQVAAGVADLLSLFDRRGPYYSICCIVEDMTKKAHGQMLTVEADDAGFSLVGVGVEDCLDFINHKDALRAKFGKLLAGQARFFQTFQPADPILDQLFTGRAQNVKLLDDLGQAFMNGRMRASETLSLARDFMNST